MYGIFTYIGVVSGVNVCKYAIHGVSGTGINRYKTGLQSPMIGREESSPTNDAPIHPDPLKLQCSKNQYWNHGKPLWKIQFLGSRQPVFPTPTAGEHEKRRKTERCSAGANGAQQLRRPSRFSFHLCRDRLSMSEETAKRRCPQMGFHGSNMLKGTLISYN